MSTSRCPFCIDSGTIGRSLEFLKYHWPLVDGFNDFG